MDQFLLCSGSSQPGSRHAELLAAAWMNLDLSGKAVSVDGVSHNLRKAFQ
jgi:hypothetical protein